MSSPTADPVTVPELDRDEGLGPPMSAVIVTDAGSCRER